MEDVDVGGRVGRASRVVAVALVSISNCNYLLVLVVNQSVVNDNLIMLFVQL